MKQKFNIITSTCVPLPLENVDTDQIIPARFLKATDKIPRYEKEGSDFKRMDHTVHSQPACQRAEMEYSDQSAGLCKFSDNQC